MLKIFKNSFKIGKSFLNLKTIGLISFSSVGISYCNRKLKHSELHEKCENELLNKHIKTTKFEKKLIEIDDNIFINTFETIDENKDKPILLLIHGWGNYFFF
jgi:hypothetical protein